MGIFVTTDGLKDVTGANSFELWNDLVSHNVLGQDIAYKTVEGRLYGAIQTAELSDLLMAHVYCSQAQTTARSKSQIESAADDTAILCLQVRGSAVLSTDWQTLRLPAGDWTLCDCRKAYTWHFSPNHGQLVLKIPKYKLKGRLNMPELAHGRILSGKKGAGKITCNYINSMWGQISNKAFELTPRFEDITLELISAAVNEAMGIPSELSRSGAVRLLEVKAYISANLRDPGLYVESIAQALQISPRYLHALFKKENATIASYIRDLRLQKCARDLKDPLLRQQSITEIAYAWGFNSHTNFTRLFRERFGMAPRDYRHSNR